MYYFLVYNDYTHTDYLQELLQSVEKSRSGHSKKIFLIRSGIWSRLLCRGLMVALH